MIKDEKNIPVVILCGGMGTRLREETEYKPKPMVEIGGKPVLWHIMKHYAHFGFRRFILCIDWTVDWYKSWHLTDENWRNLSVRQINKFRDIEVMKGHFVS